MSKDQKTWEPDINKSLYIAKNIKDLNKQLKGIADRRKIDGFNPSDPLKDSGDTLDKK